MLMFLKHFGFGPAFINMMHTFYNNLSNNVSLSRLLYDFREVCTVSCPVVINKLWMCENLSTNYLFHHSCVILKNRHCSKTRLWFLD